MVGNVITSSDPGMTSMVMNLQERSREVVDRYASEYNSFVERVGRYGNEYIGAVKRTYKRFNNRKVIRDTIDNLTTNNMLEGDNSIYDVPVDRMPRIGRRMRRYVMANPRLYRDAKRKRITGYNDQWENTEPDNDNPETRLDYLEAINGVLMHDEDGNGYTINTSHSDDELTESQRYDVISTWSRMEAMIINGEDPTDEI